MKQFIFTYCLLLLALAAFCQPGSIDLTFGNNGFAQTNVNKVGFYTDHNASALQQDGKILVGGYYLGIPKLIRYLPNGTIDSSFGNYGIAAITNFSGAIVAVTIQHDGKILVAGNKYYAPYTEHVFVARFTPEGTLDNTFGNEGISKLDFNDYAGVSALILQQDGKLLLAGGASTEYGTVDFEYSTVTRLNADGSIDRTFAEDGRLENNAANNSNAIAVQFDNRIIAVGYQNLGVNNNPDYVVSCYNADGMLDENFDNKGNVRTDGFDLNVNAESVVIQPDGKIVVGSYSIASTGYAMTALRYTENGTLNNSFGTEGKAVVLFGDKKSEAYQVLLQPGGKIVLTGTVYSNATGSEGDYALCRLNRDGSVDSSFAIDGRQVNVSESTGETAYSALLQPDGKIILIGSSQNLRTDDFYNLLIRYNGDKEQQPLAVRIKRWLNNHGISWQGLDNKNISYYSIQYSTTGKGFAEKGKVSGAVSSRLRDYNFNVADAGYYRIVAVDRKGYKTFSNKVMVSAGDLAASASVYPNPVKDYVSVQGLQTGEKASISIANGSGTVVATGTSTGSTQYRAPATSLQPGTYYLNISTGTKTETLKFVKE